LCVAKTRIPAGGKELPREAGPAQGFTQRLCFGKAVVARRLLQTRRDERRMDGLFH